MTDSHRDLDICVLTTLRTLISKIPNTYFVVTGSYSIEALTSSPVFHNDIDINILSSDITPAKSIILEKLSGLKIGDYGSLEFIGETSLRLEFRLNNTAIEIQFVQNPVGDIPLVQATLQNSAGQSFQFYVKSLPYTLATWAIRISGTAVNTKRDIRESDLENFKLLLATDYKKSEVLSCISTHPQNPGNIPSIDIFNLALAKTGLKI